LLSDAFGQSSSLALATNAHAYGCVTMITCATLAFVGALSAFYFWLLVNTCNGLRILSAVGAGIG